MRILYRYSLAEAVGSELNDVDENLNELVENLNTFFEAANDEDNPVSLLISCLRLFIGHVQESLVKCFD